MSGLVEGGKWKRCLIDMEIEIAEGGIVEMPPEVETVLGATINRRPALIKGQWYEFFPGGPGLQDGECSCVRWLLIDKGLDEETGNRLYYVKGCNDGDTLHIRAKRRFIYKGNSDLMQMRNYSALKNAVMGILAEGWITEASRNPQLSAYHWTVAGKILSNEHDEFLGDSAERQMPVQMENNMAWDVENLL